MARLIWSKVQSNTSNTSSVRDAIVKGYRFILMEIKCIHKSSFFAVYPDWNVAAVIGNEIHNLVLPMFLLLPTVNMFV